MGQKSGFFHFAPTLEYPKPPLRFTSSRCKTLQKSPCWTKPLPSLPLRRHGKACSPLEDLTEARLIAAYEHGVFPWYGENDPILWWAPEERSVLFLDSLHIAKSMRSVLNSNRFELRIDTAFEHVIQACADVRSSTEGTWISQDIIEAYIRLHDLGLAHSFEAWRDGKLVGGLYGVSIGCMFFGESMFSAESNASKFCFIQLVEWAKANGYGPIDCQISNSHLLPWAPKSFRGKRMPSSFEPT